MLDFLHQSLSSVRKKKKAFDEKIRRGKTIAWKEASPSGCSIRSRTGLSRGWLVFSRPTGSSVMIHLARLSSETLPPSLPRPPRSEILRWKSSDRARAPVFRKNNMAIEPDESMPRALVTANPLRRVTGLELTRRNSRVGLWGSVNGESINRCQRDCIARIINFQSVTKRGEQGLCFSLIDAKLRYEINLE